MSMRVTRSATKRKKESVPEHKEEEKEEEKTKEKTSKRKKKSIETYNIIAFDKDNEAQRLELRWGEPCQGVFYAHRQLMREHSQLIDAMLSDDGSAPMVVLTPPAMVTVRDIHRVLQIMHLHPRGIPTDIRRLYRLWLLYIYLGMTRLSLVSAFESCGTSHDALSAMVRQGKAHPQLYPGVAWDMLTVARGGMDAQLYDWCIVQLCLPFLKHVTNVEYAGHDSFVGNPFHGGVVRPRMLTVKHAVSCSIVAIRLLCATNGLKRQFGGLNNVYNKLYPVAMRPTHPKQLLLEWKPDAKESSSTSSLDSKENEKEPRTVCNDRGVTLSVATAEEQTVPIRHLFGEASDMYLVVHGHRYGVSRAHLEMVPGWRDLLSRLGREYNILCLTLPNLHHHYDAYHTYTKTRAETDNMESFLGWIHHCPILGSPSRVTEGVLELFYQFHTSDKQLHWLEGELIKASCITHPEILIHLLQYVDRTKHLRLFLWICCRLSPFVLTYVQDRPSDPGALSHQYRFDTAWIHYHVPLYIVLGLCAVWSTEMVSDRDDRLDRLFDTEKFEYDRARRAYHRLQELVME